MTSSAPAPRLDLSVPELISPGNELHSWIMPRPGMLNVARPGSFVTAAAARFITTDVEAEMKRRHAGATKFVYVHDFSGVTGYDPEARRILTSWGLSRRDEVERIVIVTSRTEPFIRMAISTAEAVLRVAGLQVEVADELTPVLLRYAGV